MPKIRSSEILHRSPTSWVPLLGGLLFLGALLITFWQNALNQRDMYWVLLQTEERMMTLQARMDVLEQQQVMQVPHAATATSTMMTATSTRR